jgi:hypothetical protein
MPPANDQDLTTMRIHENSEFMQETGIIREYSVNYCMNVNLPQPSALNDSADQRKIRPFVNIIRLGRLACSARFPSSVNCPLIVERWRLVSAVRPASASNPSSDTSSQYDRLRSMRAWGRLVLVIQRLKLARIETSWGLWGLWGQPVRATHCQTLAYIPASWGRWGLLFITSKILITTIKVHITN